jgi:type I restriction enzyme S subunit
LKGAGIAKSEVATSGLNAVRYGELYTRYNFKIEEAATHVSAQTARLSTKIQRGDVLFAGSGETADEIGKSAAYLCKEDGYAGGDIIIFRPGREADGLFLAYQLNVGIARKKISELGQGQSVVHLYTRDLRNVEVVLPPLAEQKRIVAMLETWDKAASKTKAEIDLKKRNKKFLTDELVLGGHRLTGFSGSWNKLTFGEAVSLRKQTVDPRKDGPQEFCVELEHIGQGTGRLIGHSTADAKASLRSTFQPGDVLFGKLRAYLRKYWLTDRPGVCSTEIWVFVANRKALLPTYLLQLITTARFIDAVTKTQGTHMPRSDWDTVKELVVTLPSVKEQEAIAEVLTAADHEINLLERKLQILEDQKKYLLNNLMTGSIPIPDKSAAVKRSSK